MSVSSHDKVEQLLAQVSLADAMPQNTVASYQSGEGSMQVVLHIGETVTFKVHGDPYLIAMMKWLQQQLIIGKHQLLRALTMVELTEMFALPEHKQKNALLILQLIDKIYAKS